MPEIICLLIAIVAKTISLQSVKQFHLPELVELDIMKTCGSPYLSLIISRSSTFLCSGNPAISVIRFPRLGAVAGVSLQGLQQQRPLQQQKLWHMRGRQPAFACACTCLHFIVTIRQYPNSLMEGGHEAACQLAKNPWILCKKSLSKQQFLARNSCLSEQSGKRRRNSWRKNWRRQWATVGDSGGFPAMGLWNIGMSCDVHLHGLSKPRLRKRNGRAFHKRQAGSNFTLQKTKNKAQDAQDRLKEE